MPACIKKSKNLRVEKFFVSLHYFKWALVCKTTAIISAINNRLIRNLLPIILILGILRFF